MKKTLITLTVGALLIASSGCSSTVTLGTAANEDSILGVSASTEGASVTVPFVKAETKTLPAAEVKKK